MRQTSLHAGPSIGGLITAMLTATILLVGCAEPSIVQPSSTPPSAPPGATTPTAAPSVGAYRSPPPTSEEDAIRTAGQVYQQYLNTYAEIYASGASDASKIDDIARGQPAADVHENSAVYAEGGVTYQGVDRFTLDAPRSEAAPSTGAAESQVDFGVVTARGCWDMSAREITNSDGSPVTLPDLTSAWVSITVEYDPAIEQWFVMSESYVDGTQTPC